MKLRNLVFITALLGFALQAQPIPFQDNTPNQATALSKPKRFQPRYPQEAIENHISGTVTLDAVVAKDGAIQDLKVTGGPSELRKETLRAVSLWSFEPEIVNGQPEEVHRIIKIKFVLGDAHAASSEGVDMLVGTNQDAPILTKAYEAKPLPPDRVRLSPIEAQKMIAHKVDPIYPASAKRNGVTGTVVLNVILDKSGKVVEVYPIGGPQLFLAAAMDAVRTWTFKPYMVGGIPKEVDTSVVVSFQ